MDTTFPRAVAWTALRAAGALALMAPAAAMATAVLLHWDRLAEHPAPSAAAVVLMAVGYSLVIAGAATEESR